MDPATMNAAGVRPPATARHRPVWRDGAPVAGPVALPPPLAGRLEAIVQLAPIGIGVVDLDGRVVLSNDALCRMLGYSAEELAAMHFREYSHPDDEAENARLLDEMLAGRRDRFQMDKRFFHRDGSEVLGRLTVSLLRDDAGAPCLHIGMLENVTRQRRLERQLSDAEVTYRLLVEDVPAVVYLYDLHAGHRAELRYVSPYVERMLGYPPGAWLSRPGLWLDRVHPDDRAEARARTTRLVEMGDNCPSGPAAAPATTAYYRMRRRDGQVIWVRDESRLIDDDGDRVVRGVLIDVTREKELEARLEQQALRDPLTQLANRELFLDRVHHCFERARRGEADGAALIYLDIDDFKTVNDSLGHAAGDDLIRSVAERIRGAVREIDTAARMGGDEFAVLLEGSDAGKGQEDARTVATRIQTALSVPFEVHGLSIRISASMGLSSLVDAPTADAAVSDADLAMYRAKRGGKARICAAPG